MSSSHHTLQHSLHEKRRGGKRPPVVFKHLFPGLFSFCPLSIHLTHSHLIVRDVRTSGRVLNCDGNTLNTKPTNQRQALAAKEWGETTHNTTEEYTTSWADGIMWYTVLYKTQKLYVEDAVAPQWQLYTQTNSSVRPIIYKRTVSVYSSVWPWLKWETIVEAWIDVTV